MALRFGETDVDKFKESVTGGQFVLWREYLRRDKIRQTPDQMYMAQIAAEVFRTVAKNPSEVKWDKFLIRFKEQEQECGQAKKMSRKARLQTSQMFWKAVVFGTKRPPKRKAQNGSTAGFGEFDSPSEAG